MRSRVQKMRVQETKSDEASAQERILDSAEELFCKNGYDSISANNIAEHAEVNKALIFYYFGSKKGLFERVLKRYYDAHQAALGVAIEGKGDVRTKMHRMIDVYLDFMSTHARYATLVQAQLAHPETHDLIEKSFEPLYRFIETVLVEVAPQQGKSSARQLFVTFSGAVLNWCTHAPLLSKVIGSNVLLPPLLDERREHLRWLVDIVLNELENSSQSVRKRKQSVTPKKH